MDTASHLWLFFGLVFGVVLLPGLDMACVLATSLGGGRRAGFAAVGGILTAAAVHVAVGGAGLAALLGVLPALYNALLVVGAAYVAWIGVALVRSGAMFETGGSAALEGISMPTAYRRGLLTNLLNPKAYAFMLAIFPQFVRRDAGPIWVQAVVLGSIIVVTQVTVYGAVVLAATRARGWLADRPRVLAVMGRTVGLLLVAVAVLSALEGWKRVG
ncbi:MAG: LysE family translocator [Thermoanaerobaculia bacterium]